MKNLFDITYTELIEKPSEYYVLTVRYGDEIDSIIEMGNTTEVFAYLDKYQRYNKEIANKKEAEGVSSITINYFVRPPNCAKWASMEFWTRFYEERIGGE